MDTEKAQEKLTELHGKKSGKMVIGPAGENLVRYACMISEERAVGRGGAGTVMGSKNLKGMVALGTGKVEVADPDGFKKAIKSWIDYLKKHPVTGDALPAYGTDGLLLKASTLNVLPTRNFSSGHFEHADEICGEAMAEKHLVKNAGCLSCPIRCARVVEVDGKQVKGPEFETVGMFGSNIGNRDLGLIKTWNVVMDRLGLDTITCGGVLGFAMEATEKGLMKTDLAFGKIDNIEQHINDIAWRRGIGNDLAEGVMRLSEKYGGAEFAMHAKGLEFAAYEPRGAVGHGLGYATANRGGCHLNSGYLVYFEALGPVNFDPLTPKAKPEYVIFQQNTLEALSACGSCIFTSYAVIPPQAHTSITPYGPLAQVLSKVLLGSAPAIGAMVNLPGSALPIHLPMIPHSKAIARASGQKMSAGLFMEAGARGYNLERMFNVREGMVLDTLPRRLTEEHQIPGRPETRVPLNKMLPRYYKVRGWDHRGVPQKKTLKALKLEFALKDIPDRQEGKDQLFDRFTRRRLAYESKQAAFIADTVKRNVKMAKG
jgi:aldehyde:ferredoxin oxidoreductase